MLVNRKEGGMPSARPLRQWAGLDTASGSLDNTRVFPGHWIWGMRSSGQLPGWRTEGQGCACTRSLAYSACRMSSHIHFGFWIVFIYYTKTYFYEAVNIFSFSCFRPQRFFRILLSSYSMKDTILYNYSMLCFMKSWKNCQNFFCSNLIPWDHNSPDYQLMGFF